MQLLSLLILLVLAGGQQAADGGIEGVVVRTGTTTPIAGADVTLERPGQPTVATRTGENGRFSFNDLEAGTYTVRVQRDGFFGALDAREQSAQRLLDSVSLSIGRPVADSMTTAALTATLDLAPSEHRRNLTYSLTPGGILTGHVLRRGSNVPGVTVTALRMNYREGQRSLTPVKSALSNDRGDFRISWLEVGEYLLRADLETPEGNVRSYFPGADWPEQAVRVRVEEGKESPSLNLLVGERRRATFSGAITNISSVVQQSPTTQRTARYILVPVDREIILDGSVDVTNAVMDVEERLAGKFEIRDVRPGTYDFLVLISERAREAPSERFPVYAGRARIEVGNADVSGIRLTVSRGSEVRGTVTPQGGGLRIFLQPAGSLAGLFLGANYATTIQPDGSFTLIDVIPSSYSVSVSGLPQGVYVADILQSGRSVFDTGIVTVDGSSANLGVVLNSPAATIAGTVSGSGRLLSSDMAVVLQPLERADNTTLYRRVAVSNSGSFSIGGVVPGRYRILAVENLPSTAELNRSFMETFRDRWVEIAATGGQTLKVDLKAN